MAEWKYRFSGSGPRLSGASPKTPLTALGLKPAQPKQASPAPLFEKPGGAISDERVAPLGATPDAGAARALLP